MEKFLNYESSFYALVINKMESQAINHPAGSIVLGQPPIARSYRSGNNMMSYPRVLSG